MENIFSSRRFGNSLNKHFREHLRTYLMSLIVFGAIILVFFMFLVFTSQGRPLSISNQSMVFILSFWLGICIFSGNIFSNYNHSRSAFTSTMLPASILEKYLLYWLISLIGFSVCALGVYHLSQIIIIEYLKTQGIQSTVFYFWKSDDEKFVKILTGLYLLSHSIAFLGAICFRKKTVIVTALVAFVIIAAYVYLNYQVSLVALNGNSSIPVPFFPASIYTTDGWAEISTANNELWGTISLSTLIILLWICAFFKLKERQV